MIVYNSPSPAVALACVHKYAIVVIFPLQQFIVFHDAADYKLRNLQLTGFIQPIQHGKLLLADAQRRGGQLLNALPVSNIFYKADG